MNALSIHLLSIVLLVLGFVVPVNAESIVLKSGDVVEGDIVRTEGEKVTVRTESGYSTWHLNELDQDWVNEHYGDLFTEVRREQLDAVTGAGALTMGLLGEDSLARATPFLMEHKTTVFYASGGVILVGLLLCFFGWKFFRITTIIGGVLSGIMLGVGLGILLGVLAGSPFTGETAKGVQAFVSIIAAIPLAVIGAKYGRRFAMFNARLNTLNGAGAGALGAVFALTRFAFFDLSIIWGHALVGAALLIVGLYCGAVPALELVDTHLRPTLFLSVAFALAICVFGAVMQIRSLRGEPGPAYRGEY